MSLCAAYCDDEGNGVLEPERDDVRRLDLDFLLSSSARDGLVGVKYEGSSWSDSLSEADI